MAKKKQDDEVTEVTAGANRLPAKIEDGDYALFHITPERVKSLIAHNIGNAGLDEFKLDKVKVPGLGSTTWTIETLRGEEETKVIRGIIVAYKEPRSFWEESYQKETMLACLTWVSPEFSVQAPRSPNRQAKS